MAEFDLVVRGGQVIDGSGTEGRAADVAVRGSTIVEVGRVARPRVKREIALRTVPSSHQDSLTFTRTTMARSLGPTACIPPVTTA